MDSLPLDQIILSDNCDALRTFPSGSIDLVVTSPPYDSMRKYGGHSWDFYGVAWNLARIIKPGGVTWTNEGEVVLDPFSGSGTTAEMARNLGRRYIGLEVNPEYVEISRKRMAQQLLFGAEG